MTPEVQRTIDNFRELFKDNHEALRFIDNLLQTKEPVLPTTQQLPRDPSTIAAQTVPVEKQPVPVGTFDELVVELQRYLTFEPGWDGYHAPAFKKQDIDNAIAVLFLFKEQARLFPDVRIMQVEVGPCPDGTVDVMFDTTHGYVNYASSNGVLRITDKHDTHFPGMWRRFPDMLSQSVSSTEYLYGRLEESEYIGLHFAGTHNGLTEHLKKYHGQKINLSYHISDSEITEQNYESLPEQAFLAACGLSSIDHYTLSSETTGFMYVDETLIVNGHDVHAELSAHVGLWCCLRIDVSAPGVQNE